MRLAALIAGIAYTATLSAAQPSYTVVEERFIYCTTCHGVELAGNRSVDAPRLNGMEGWYVAAQMRAFAAGRRGTHPEDITGMEMQPQAAALGDSDIDAAVRFVRSVKRRGRAGSTIQGDAERGAALYASCAACHGERGQGERALGAPRLAGQSDWYLARQLDRYLAGARGYAPDDTTGTQMRAAAGVLARGADVRDVVAYINTLSTD